jgi:hypothetical protein
MRIESQHRILTAEQVARNFRDNTIEELAIPNLCLMVKPTGKTSDLGGLINTEGDTGPNRITDGFPVTLFSEVKVEQIETPLPANRCLRKGAAAETYERLKSHMFSTFGANAMQAPTVQSLRAKVGLPADGSQRTAKRGADVSPSMPSEGRDGSCSRRGSIAGKRSPSADGETSEDDEPEADSLEGAEDVSGVGGGLMLAEKGPKRKYYRPPAGGSSNRARSGRKAAGRGARASAVGASASAKTARVLKFPAIAGSGREPAAIRPEGFVQKDVCPPKQGREKRSRRASRSEDSRSSWVGTQGNLVMQSALWVQKRLRGCFTFFSGYFSCKS